MHAVGCRRWARAHCTQRDELRVRMRDMEKELEAQREGDRQSVAAQVDCRPVFERGPTVECARRQWPARRSQPWPKRTCAGLMLAVVECVFGAYSSPWWWAEFSSRCAPPSRAGRRPPSRECADDFRAVVSALEHWVRVAPVFRVAEVVAGLDAHPARVAHLVPEWQFGPQTADECRPKSVHHNRNVGRVSIRYAGMAQN